MITNEQAETLIFIYIIVLVLCRLLSVTLGTVAIFRRNGALRELGFFLLATGVLSLWSAISTYLLRISQYMAVIVSYINFGVAILSYAAYILFYLYLRRVYRSRGLLYVCLFPPLWFIAMRFVQAFIVNKVSSDSLAMTTSIMNIVTAIAPIAIWIFFTAVCMMNREKEKTVPRLYVWCILNAVFTLVDASYLLFSGYLPNIVNYITALILSLLAPAFGIYLNVCLSRLSTKPKEV